MRSVGLSDGDGGDLLTPVPHVIPARSVAKNEMHV